ncbi:TolC family protein [Lacipirellula limnantheis]|uniref:Outer membrane efflux protein n=1 Tax=Lacipirellula limnantheis TaxID=2528024 RepID=A0A517TVD4_9BACT|nr:TolC family protein [Lacipirellula limnantheis]QDT72331.1 Outer membrane efflux protein [Lacipirellula limnantheis]
MRSFAWTLACVVLISGCRSSANFVPSGDGVDPIPKSSAAATPTPAPSAAASPEKRSDHIQLAAYQPEALPPVTLVNPAEVDAEAAPSFPELLPAPLGESASATLDDVISSVYANYPAIEAAARERQIAAGKQLAAMGKFDSNLIGQAISEPLGYYKNYRYDLGVKQYNWGGSQTYAGYRLGRGFFEPWYLERDTNQGGEFKAGVTLPFLRDRDIDKRRAAVYKAQLDQTAAEPIVQLEVIDAVLGASLAYWDWVAAGQRTKVARKLLNLAVDRQQGMEKRAARGDIAGIALTDNQRLIVSRQAKLIEAERKLQQSAIKLSLFFRDPLGTPLMVTPDQLPADFPPATGPDQTAETAETAQALQQRPELWLLRLESERAQVDVRQASNLLLPSIDGVMVASQDVGAPTKQIRDKSQFEMEAGALIEVPLQRSAARGKLQEAQGKLAQISAKRRFTEQKIIAEVQSARTALAAEYAALEQARQSYSLALKMEEAEWKKFEQGDSDLLIVNLREQAAADAETLVVDAAATYFTAAAQLHAAIAGELSGARRVAQSAPLPIAP